MSDAINFVEWFCPDCQKKLKAPRAYVGKRVKCNGCGQTIRVPGGASIHDDDWLKLDTPAVNTREVAPPKEEKVHTFAWQKKESKVIVPPEEHAPESASEEKPRQPASVENAVPRGRREEPAPIPFDHEDFDPDNPFGDKSTGDAAANAAIPVVSKPAPIPNSRLLDLDAEIAAITAAAGVPQAITPDPLEIPDLNGTADQNRTADMNGGSVASKRGVPSSSSGPAEVRSKAPDGPPAFRFKCKTCGTQIYATVTAVGTVVKCPDCYDLLKVPKPPADWNPKTAQSAPSEKNDLLLEPVQRTNRASERFADDNLKDMMRKAEVEVIEDEAKDLRDVYDFDTTGWIQQNFGFLKDPMLLLIGIGTGVLLGSVFAATHFFGNIGGDLKGVATLFQLFVLAAGGVPILSTCLANGLAVLEAGANRQSKVDEWPILNPGEWIAEGMAVVVAFILAAVPGGVVGRLLADLGGGYVLTIAMVVCSISIFAPPILLSILDNQSLAQPFSKDIFGSIPKRVESWLGMYLMVCIASAMMFVLLAMAVVGGMIVGFIAGVVFPLYLFFYFNQLGLLLSKIGDLTNLPFAAPDPKA